MPFLQDTVVIVFCFPFVFLFLNQPCEPFCTLHPVTVWFPSFLSLSVFSLVLHAPACQVSSFPKSRLRTPLLTVSCLFGYRSQERVHCCHIYSRLLFVFVSFYPFYCMRTMRVYYACVLCVYYASKTEGSMHIRRKNKSPVSVHL